MTALSIASSRYERGMALIVVLWLVVLLSVMAAGHAKNVHTDTLLASRQLESTEARALAEASVHHVVYSMLGKAGMPVDGRPFEVSIHGDRALVAVRNARGLVDLNAAEPTVLETLLDAAGVEEARRAGLVETILDWRDVDDLPRLHGAEVDTYRAAGLPWSPRNGSFASIDELRYIPGIDAALFAKLAPLVTIHSGYQGIDLEFAPPALIRAMTGKEMPVGNPVEAGAVRGGTFHIYASAPGGAGTVIAVEAVVRVSSSSGAPFTIVDWHVPARALLPVAEESTG